MEHSSLCFNHEFFIQNLLKVNNSDLYYTSLQFYIDEEPLYLNDFLKEMTQKLDFGRVCKIVQSNNCLMLVLDWLKFVQPQNNTVVNDVLNNLYLQAQDFVSLRKSIMTYDQFNAIELAQKIEESENIEF